jgi:flagellar protein FliS
MLTSPIQKYQQSSVQTASPGQLILMLYDGAIRFVKLGIAGIEEKDIGKAHNSFVRAQSIINELMASLNMSIPISLTLMRIYEYLNRRLIEANIKKDQGPAEEVLEHLTELRGAWAQIMQRQQGQNGHVE